MNESKDLKRIQEFVDKLKSTNSTNDKIEIIKTYKDDYLINQVLKYTYSPFKQFHLTSATVKKNKKLEPRGGYHDLFYLLDALTKRTVTAKVMEGRSLDAAEFLKGVKNIIAVASGKGGVGKSTVALNLALALSKTGAKVGLLDADVYGPSIPLMLGMKGTMMEVDQEKRKLIPPECEGIRVVSFGFFGQEDHKPAMFRGPIISGVVKQFLVDTLWIDLDYLIVDLPPGTGDIPLTLAQTCQPTGILVVTTPQEVASSVASKAIGMFSTLNVPMLGVIENMSYFECSKCNEKHYIFGKGGAERISEKHNMPVVGAIPLNSGIMEGSELGKPVMITQPDSPSAKAFTVAAKNIAAQCSIQHFKIQQRLEAGAKWGGLSPEERQKILVGLLDESNYNIAPEDENKTWDELEQGIQDALVQHLLGESKVQTTPTAS